ncbi:claudin-4-like [Nematolebias whitei]|uniref:claudin-4-like n=1 Tax=Nematolebias whitei TaxID=451745 RepID=UPI001896B781|nr:claudin-4-like [Nematolebias whitei]
MASMGIQLLASILCLLGWGGVIFCCLLPMWKVTAFVGSTIMTSQIIWEGIWMTCVVQSTGQVQCKSYESMLALTSDLQAARALMVLSIATGGLGLILAFIGGKCTRFLDEEGNGAKGKVAILAGAVLIITGLLCLIPTSWTAGMVVKVFYGASIDAQRRELGACLYIGWLASILLVLGGGLFLKTSCLLEAHDTDKSPSVRYLAVRSSKGSTKPGSYHSRMPSVVAQPMRVLSPRPQSFEGDTIKPQLFTSPSSEQNSREDSEKSWAPSIKSQLKRPEPESGLSAQSEALSTKSQLKRSEIEETLSAASNEKEDASSNPQKTYL